MYDGKVVFEIDADTKSFDVEIEKTKKELSNLLKRYDETKNMKPFKGQEEDLKNLEIEIEKTNNKLVGLKNQQQKLQQESTKTGKTMNDAFSKGLRSARNLVVGIIGVRSAYMLARRAASAYMSENEELTKKMQSAWVGLGAFLEPFLSFVADAMLKLVGYLNVFIKALTGTDYIARANAKAIEKQAKAQSKLNKEMDKYQNYDFDVIRTQQSSYSGYEASGGETSGLINIPELNANIVKKLQDLAHWLKENKNLIEAVGIALGITFGAAAIGKLLSNIGLLIGSSAMGTGLLGLLAILSSIAIVWSFKVIWDNWNELQEQLKIAKNQLNKFDEQLEETGKVADEETKNIENYSNIFNTLSFAVEREIGSIKANNRVTELNTKIIKENMRQLNNAYKAGKLTEEQTKKLKDLNILYKDTLVQVTQGNKNNQAELFKLKTTSEDYYDIFSDIDKIELDNIDTQKKQQEQIKETDIKVKDLAQSLLNIPKSLTTNIFVNLDKKEAENKLSALEKKFEKLGIFGTPMLNIIKNVTGFANGGLVTQPTMSIIGEAGYNEYVIPEREDYISRLASEIGKYGSGGGTTNVYLDGRLIQRQVSKTANQVSFTRNGR